MSERYTDFKHDDAKASDVYVSIYTAYDGATLTVQVVDPARDDVLTMTVREAAILRDLLNRVFEALK